MHSFLFTVCLSTGKVRIASSICKHLITARPCCNHLSTWTCFFAKNSPGHTLPLASVPAQQLTELLSGTVAHSWSVAQRTGRAALLLGFVIISEPLMKPAKLQGVHLHSTHDAAAAALYARFPMHLHLGCITCDWDRYITPPPHNLTEEPGQVRPCQKQGIASEQSSPYNSSSSGV